MRYEYDADSAQQKDRDRRQTQEIREKALAELRDQAERLGYCLQPLKGDQKP